MSIFHPSGEVNPPSKRQGINSQQPLSLLTAAVFAVALGIQTTRILLDNNSSTLLSQQPNRQQDNTDTKYRLENDPMCGQTTGGRSECDWDCVKGISSFLGNSVFQSSFNMYANIDCLDDCFAPDHCVSLLIEDVKSAGGVCPESSQTQGNPDALCALEQYTTNTAPEGSCTYGTIEGEFSQYQGIIRGICSPKTEAALIQTNCIYDIMSKTPIIQGTIWRTVLNSCRREVYNIMDAVTAPPPPFFPGLPFPLKRDFTPRLNPLFGVAKLESGQYVRTELEFENTKQRYPWLCSLRDKSPKKNHYCAVTLLRKPPGPIVMVTTAHCTFLCKSGNRVVPNCCCDNVGGNKCKGNQKCGNNPKVTEMSKDDVEVICGEWEIGSNSKESSGEKFNVVFTIEEIKRHPDFRISRGTGKTQFVINDIATIHVSNNDEDVFTRNNINPACLPNQPNTLRQPSETSRENRNGIELPFNPIPPFLFCPLQSIGLGLIGQTPIVDLPNPNTNFGYHAGWSTPPKRSYIKEYAPLYLPFYRDFQKLWHYKMEIARCTDPIQNDIDGTVFRAPSFTYYPPGTVCAKETSRYFCPTSGESGSPLMTEQDGLYVADGILSFIKGCGAFSFGVENFRLPIGFQYLPNGTSLLYQQSNNPSVYTKLSCYLYWISQQYNLEYAGNAVAEEECSQGYGNFTVTDENGQEIEQRECLTNPSTSVISFDGGFPSFDQNGELPCLFPYYIDGTYIEDACIQFDIGGLNYPVFTCPVRNITTKFPGTNINSYTTEGLSSLLDIFNGYCQDQTQWDPFKELLPPLNPESSDCSRYDIKKPFANCKNNCRGVNFPVVSGGAALLAAGVAVGVGAPIIGPVVGPLAAGTALTSPLLAGLGLIGVGAAGVGGNMVAESMCLGPIYCRASNGQCCLLVFSNGRALCPLSC